MKTGNDKIVTGHLKERILVPDLGGSGFQAAGMRLHAEDLKRASNIDMGLKDVFEMTCKRALTRASPK